MKWNLYMSYSKFYCFIVVFELKWECLPTSTFHKGIVYTNRNKNNCFVKTETQALALKKY